MCIQRLPSSTVSLWEHSVKDKTALSHWKDLSNFLTERIQTLDCLHDLKGQGLSKNFSIRSESVSSDDNTSTGISCVLCPNRSHFLRNCQQFKNLSIPNRISTVNRNKCCSNCLSRTHDVSRCDNRHHTMLHQDCSDNSIVRPTTSSEENSATILRPTDTTLNHTPSTSTGITHNYQTFHARQRRSVLLGTAMVNIIHNGNRYKVRALIDSASESSFVSEGLQRRLNLTTHSMQSRVSGINNSVSVCSRKICTLKISSDLDSSIILNTTALVLPQISGNLPSFSHTDMQGRLPNLRLADFNPFDSRPVEILIGADLYPEVILPEIRKNILGSILGQNTVFGWILTGPINTPILRSYFTNIN